MTSKHLWIIIAAVGAIAAGMALVTVGPDDKLVPHFHLETASGRRFYLREHLGKCVVLVFWSTACVPCKEEMAFLAELHSDLGEKRLVIAGICTDAESPDQAEAIADQLRISYAIPLDTDGKVAKSLGIKAVPTTVLINAAGVEVWRREGYDPAVRRAIRSQVDRVLLGPEGER